MNEQEKNNIHNRAFCVAAVVWLILASVLPLAELWAVVVALIAMGVTYFVVKSHAMK